MGGWHAQATCDKLSSTLKLTVLLAAALTPSDVLRGAEEVSLHIGHSPQSPLGRRCSCGLWLDVDFETASPCKNITGAVKLASPPVWPNGLGRERSQRWLGRRDWREERKQEAEVNCWEKGNLHSKFSLTVAYKAACMCGSSLERTEIMTLSDIPVKMSCLAHLPVIS